MGSERCHGRETGLGRGTMVSGYLRRGGIVRGGNHKQSILLSHTVLNFEYLVSGKLAELAVVEAQLGS